MIQKNNFIHQPIMIVMGSTSDMNTMKDTCALIKDFHIPFSAYIISAHRTPHRLYDFSKSINSNNKTKIIIAAAGGAAHLPGMLSALITLPVIGVPIQSKVLTGMDSLLSIVQMPAGIPTATVSIGKNGAINAALLAISMLSLNSQYSYLKESLLQHREKQKQKVPQDEQYFSSTVIT